MKKTVLRGSDVEKKVQLQEVEISKAKEVLDRETLEERKLQKLLDDKAKGNLKIQQKYESSQAQIDDLNEKIQLVNLLNRIIHFISYSNFFSLETNANK